MNGRRALLLDSLMQIVNQTKNCTLSFFFSPVINETEKKKRFNIKNDDKTFGKRKIKHKFHIENLERKKDQVWKEEKEKKRQKKRGEKKVKLEFKNGK